MQAGCIRYASECDAAVVRRAARDTVGNRRRAAVASLGRLMFLPQPRELAVLSDFEHDVNLGTDSLVGLFDPAVAQSGLRRRGLFYLKDAERSTCRPNCAVAACREPFAYDAARFARPAPGLTTAASNCRSSSPTAQMWADRSPPIRPRKAITVAVPVGASRFAMACSSASSRPGRARVRGREGL